MMRKSLTTQGFVRRTLAMALVAAPLVAVATPPAHAPAHGWRKKNDPTYAGYTGYSGKGWDSDYGVKSGSCDRSRVGQVLGGVVGGVAGGVIGSEVAKDNGATRNERTVATVLGAVIGAAIGSEVGRRMDRTDRSCVGHALELADAGSSVKWTNPNTRVTYQLTPLEEGSRREDSCRRFRLIAHGSFGLSEGNTVACAGSDGVWRLRDGGQRLTQR